MPFVTPKLHPKDNTNPTPPSGEEPAERIVQGDSFDPEDVEDVEKPKSTLFADALAFLHEDGDSENPFNKKKLVVIGIAACAVLLIICTMISSGFQKNQKGVVDVLSEPVAFQGESSTVAPPVVPAPPAFQYTDEQKQKLRSVGYTGSDIEKFEAQQITDIDKLILDQKAKIREEIRAQYRYLQDQVIGSVDAETAEIYANTWYGLDAQFLGAERVNEYGEKEGAARTALKENVDYTKIPMLGNQCWLKLELLDGTIAFYAVSPERYTALEKEQGNIVIQYNRLVWRDCVFIQDIKEVTVK